MTRYGEETIAVINYLEGECGRLRARAQSLGISVTEPKIAEDAGLIDRRSILETHARAVQAQIETKLTEAARGIVQQPQQPAQAAGTAVAELNESEIAELNWTQRILVAQGRLSAADARAAIAASKEKVKAAAFKGYTGYSAQCAEWRSKNPAPESVRSDADKK